MVGAKEQQQGHALGENEEDTQAVPITQSENYALTSVANLCVEEPYALIGLVRVCGGSGWETARFYPDR
jgi:hypothetical protein